VAVLSGLTEMLLYVDRDLGGRDAELCDLVEAVEALDVIAAAFGSTFDSSRFNARSSSHISSIIFIMSFGTVTESSSSVDAEKMESSNEKSAPSESDSSSFPRSESTSRSKLVSSSLPLSRSKLESSRRSAWLFIKAESVSSLLVGEATHSPRTSGVSGSSPWWLSSSSSGVSAEVSESQLET